MGKAIQLPDTAKGRAEFKRWQKFILSNDIDVVKHGMLTELTFIHKRLNEIRTRQDYVQEHFMKEKK